MKKLHLKVEGMHCKSCEIVIKEALEEAGGVDVQVSEKKGTVSLGIDEKRLSESKVKEIIEKEGYSIK